MLIHAEKPFNKIQQIEEAFSVWERTPTKANKASSHPDILEASPYDWNTGRRSTVMTFIQRHVRV